MKRWTLWLAGAGVLVAGAALMACPEFAPDDVCGYPGFCGDSSTEAGDGGRDGGALCPSGKEPKDDPTCVSDTLGVFVAPAPTGSDTNPGTKASPFATLKTALQKVGGKAMIFVCEGSYTESVDIAQSISIFGGFKCADWSYSAVQPKFTGTKPDYVFHLNAANDTLIADIELDAIDGASGTGQSSIGAFVALSQNVTFERIVVRAGKGADGPNGKLTQYSYPTPALLLGNDADGGIGGGARTYSGCQGRWNHRGRQGRR